MYKLRIENGSFGFVIPEVHTLKETDITIKEEDYSKFFEIQNSGISFKLKDIPTGNELFDYVEEIPPSTEIRYSTGDRIAALEKALLEVL